MQTPPGTLRSTEKDAMPRCGDCVMLRDREPSLFAHAHEPVCAPRVASGVPMTSVLSTLRAQPLAQFRVCAEKGWGAPTIPHHTLPSRSLRDQTTTTNLLECDFWWSGSTKLLAISEWCCPSQQECTASQNWEPKLTTLQTSRMSQLLRHVSVADADFEPTLAILI